MCYPSIIRIDYSDFHDSPFINMHGIQNPVMAEVNKESPPLRLSESYQSSA
jgi:hypothetical protein